MVKYSNVLIYYIKQRNDLLSIQSYYIQNPREPKMNIIHFLLYTLYQYIKQTLKILYQMFLLNQDTTYFSAVAYRCSTHAFIYSYISKAFYSSHMGSSVHYLMGSESQLITREMYADTFC